jgi:ferric-dicitrate binding protein FerR (iron transport regulator)
MIMDESHFRRLIDAYLAGKASPAEKKLLDDFFDSYPGGRHPALAEDEQARQALWKKIAGKLPAEESSSRPVFSLTPWYSVAAVFALFITVFYFLVYKRQHEETSPARMAVREQQATTARGQKLKVELVDGSQVILNANSKLTFPEHFSGNTREVYLEGEAYFQVAHDAAHPFIVHTRVANTTVLGTSFNVMSTAAGETEITLVEGKVDVTSQGPTAANGVHQILLPNQQAIVTEGSETIQMRNVDVTAYVDWIDNVLHFDNVTLAEAALKLEAWYNVDITFENPALAKCTINATYTKETLNNILNSLEYMLKIGYRKEGNTIVLTGKGCN